MDDKYRSFLIQELKQELIDASNISTKSIASKIEDIGFSCLICGKCCRFAFGDNRVLLTPCEIQVIEDHTEHPAHKIANPATPDDPDFTDLIDIEGRIHTFGWMLVRKSNGDCIFIEGADVSNRCKIHGVCPMLCRTYPFYIQNMELHTSECEGLGQKIAPGESLKIAIDVINRYLIEIKDTIALYEKFDDFITSPESVGVSTICADGKKHFICVVHDSKGSHTVISELDEDTNIID
ncbi:MAG: YkgJ family cysteine cluster protein [Methanosarcinaceae archaeon]